MYIAVTLVGLRIFKQITSLWNQVTHELLNGFHLDVLSVWQLSILALHARNERSLWGIIARILDLDGSVSKDSYVKLQSPSMSPSVTPQQ